MASSSLHPLVVHFPVALLSVYAVAELIRFKRVTGQPYWFYVKAIALLVGCAGALVARQTGEAIEESLEATGAQIPRLMEVHSNWSLIATWIFVVLAAAYVLAWIRRDGGSWGQKLEAAGDWAGKLVSSWLSAILALAGLAAITATGALGAALVYGPGVDPAVNAIYRLLVGQP